MRAGTRASGKGEGKVFDTGQEQSRDQSQDPDKLARCREENNIREGDFTAKGRGDFPVGPCTKMMANREGRKDTRGRDSVPAWGGKGNGY